MAKSTNKFGITENAIREMLKNTSASMKKFKRDFIDKYGTNLSNKLKSELVSKILEAEAERVFSKTVDYEVVKEKSDKEPDLFFTRIKMPLEIKTTSTDKAWTGGEFSQRPFDYLLISWGGDFDEFFVALAKINKKDWESRMSKRFYGPAFTAKSLYEIKNKTIFVGYLKKTKNGAVKIVREKI